jgi:hypothetical protein
MDDDGAAAKDIRKFLSGEGKDPAFEPVRPHWEALLAYFEGRAGDMSLAELREHQDAITRFGQETQAALDERNAELDTQIAEGRRRLFGGPDEPRG